MKRLFFIRLALQNTFKKKLRAVMAVGGIALTCAVMITLFGVQEGLHQLVQREINSADAQDVITVNQRNVQQIRLDDKRISNIVSISGVSQVGQSVGFPGTAVYHGISLDVPTYGVSNEYFDMGPVTTLKGSIDGQPQGSNIIVSSKVLDVFGIKINDAVGKKVSISIDITGDYSSTTDNKGKQVKPATYTVVGVVDRGALPVIFMPLEDFRQQGVDSVAQLKVRVSSVEKQTSVREVIEQMGLQTTSVLDIIGRINQLFDVIRNLLLIFGVIVFAITVAGTFTIISLTLMEETRQVGFLRIMGLRRGDIKTLFVIQSVILTMLGAVGAVAIGLVTGFAVNGVARAAANAESFSGDISLFVIPVVPIIIILMLSVLIGWGVGIVPAKRAALMDPLEELEM